jgi:hypothetical protein
MKVLKPKEISPQDNDEFVHVSNPKNFHLERHIIE